LKKKISAAAKAKQEQIRDSVRKVKIKMNLGKALDAYIKDQSGRMISANNTTLIVTCTQLKCLLKGLV
jgi:hypothetical protein